MNADAVTIFALNTSRGFGERVCLHLHLSLQAHEERELEGGEHKTRPLVNVRVHGAGHFPQALVIFPTRR